MIVGRITITALLLAFCTSAQAARIVEIKIDGLDDVMAVNVRKALSLEDARDKQVSDARLDYLLRAAEDETRAALEPFGYYSPQIVIRESVQKNVGNEDVQTTQISTESLPSEETPILVTVTVTLGEPVRVRRASIAINGAGTDDRYLKQELAGFTPRVGDVFAHNRYEQSKALIGRRLAERGYFDADFKTRKVEVTRAEQAADIDLTWNSGNRYSMGDIRFVQMPKPVVRDALLQQFVYWKAGDYYHQGRLDRLRKSLTALDYFSRIDIDPQPAQAKDGRVPVDVRLTPAKRSIYTTGLSFGTDSGFGTRLGVERRYLNAKGHKGLAQLDYTEQRKTLTLQHRIPAFAWLDGWYTTSVQAYDEQTDYIDTRRYEVVFSRSGQYSHDLNLIAAVHALRERWAYAYQNTTQTNAAALFQQSTFLYPSLQAEYLNADDRIQPRDGVGATALIRGGLQGAGSDANFAQLQLRASWFRGLGARSRVIVRGEVGLTFTNALIDVPPSLRFYAGGDRSVRGYEYREIGPRIPAAPGRRAFALGAKNVLTSNIEYEHYLTERWGFAAFVDGGSAFDGKLDRWRTGVGIGVRWKSPVGPLRVDVAHGVNDPDSAFTLHINLGADL